MPAAPGAVPSGSTMDGHVLRFHPLTFLDEGGEVTVGRPDLESYVVLPADGAALLQRLRDGDTPRVAAGWYQEHFGEHVDIDDFVAALRDLQFVREDDAVAAATGASGTDASGREAGAGPTTDGGSTAPEPVRWQRLGRAVFSKPAWVLYTGLLGVAVVLCLLHPELAPRRQHVFFTGSLVLVELGLMVLSLPLTLLHELAHVLAGRRLGLRTRVRVSRRYYFLVFETVMNGLVAVPRRQRYLPMLAGILTDLVTTAALTIAAWLLRDTLVGAAAWIPRLCLALAFTNLLRIAWQLYFFLRTDVYYLVTTVLGCVDLQTTARQMLANALNRRLHRYDRLVDESTWHPRDRQAARWYAPLLVAGYSFATVILVGVLVPTAWTFLSAAVGRVFFGHASTTAQFWDSALLLGINGAQLLFAAVLAIRERRSPARRASQYQPRHAVPTHHRPEHAIVRPPLPAPRRTS